MKRFLLLLAAAGFVYFPIIHGTWLWDDPSEIAGNPLLRDPQGLVKIWLGQGTPDYFPLKTSLQWLQWHLWGDQVAGYHLTNWGLHVLAALLLWRLLDRLNVRFSFFGALLFAVHPFAVESVAWISELKNVLSLPLLLGAFLAYLDFEKTARKGSYAGAVALFAAAALAKSSVVMFPCVLLLYAFWRRGKVSWRDWAPTAPFFLISAGLGLLTIRFQSDRVMAYLPMPVESFATRLAGAGWAIWSYLSKCLVPAGLLPIYPRWAMQPAMEWLVPPWLALVAAFGWFWARRDTWGRAALFGCGSFVLNLLPVLGIVPLAYARISRVSDHLGYLPLVSVIALVCAGLAVVAEQDPLWIRSSRAHWTAATVLILAAMFASRSYARVFVSEEAMWTYTVRHNPDAWLAHNNLGIILAQTGRLEAAAIEGAAAVKLRPDLAEARTNYGLTLLRLGHTPEALPQLQAAVRLNPHFVGAHLNLGQAWLEAGRSTDGINEFAEAHRLDPNNPDARSSLRAALNNAANAQARAGHLEAAVSLFRAAIAVDPTEPGTHRNLSYALHSLGRDEEALRELDEAEHLGAR